MGRQLPLLGKIGVAIAALAAGILVPVIAGAEPGFSAVQPMPRAVGVPTSQAGPYTAVSCPTASSCTAVASSTELAKLGELTAITEVGTAWGAPTALPLPANAHVSSAYGPYANDVSCSAADTCTAVGAYPTSGSYSVPLVETETAGTWTPTELALPVGARDGSITKLWCATQGTCITAGYEVPPGSTSTTVPIVTVEASGVWGAALRLIVPTGAKYVLPESIGCSDVDDCVVTAQAYSGTTFETVYWTESAGAWSTARRFTAPTGDEFLADSVACPSSLECLVVGDLSGPRGLAPAAATYSAGTLSLPRAIPEPQLSPLPQEGEFTDIACSGATTCEAVGLFVGETAEVPGAATWSDGTWSSVGLFDHVRVHGISAKGSLLLGVSCASTTSCTAIGYDVALKTLGGTIAAEGDFSMELAPVRPVTQPGPPTSLDPTGVVNGVDVGWAPPNDDGGSAVLSYAATVAPNGQHCATTQRQCRIVGLVNGRRYEVTVRDLTGYGVSAPTSASFVAGTVPQVPQQVQGTVHNSRITATWLASSAPAPEAVTSYVVTVWRGGVLLDTRRTTQLTCAFGSFRSGTYAVEVAATDASGTSQPATVQVQVP
jgi:hypothetical protein